MKQSSSPGSESLTLTERLAADRTRLANERTLLAYVRTALGLIVSGTGFGEYLDSPVLRTVFLLFIPLGVVILGTGIVGFRRRRKTLSRYLTESAEPINRPS